MAQHGLPTEDGGFSRGEEKGKKARTAANGEPWEVVSAQPYILLLWLGFTTLRCWNYHCGIQHPMVNLARRDLLAQLSLPIPFPIQNKKKKNKHRPTPKVHQTMLSYLNLFYKANKEQNGETKSHNRFVQLILSKFTQFHSKRKMSLD